MLLDANFYLDTLVHYLVHLFFNSPDLKKKLNRTKDDTCRVQILLPAFDVHSQIDHLFNFLSASASQKKTWERPWTLGSRPLEKISPYVITFWTHDIFQKISLRILYPENELNNI
jgi:hypothetical protein